MFFDYGFDVYPPLEPTKANQERYEKFVDAVLALIRAVSTIAKEYFGDRVYEYSETSVSDRSQGTGSAALPLREIDANETISLDTAADPRLYEVKEVPGKGQGMIATSGIPKGARILLEGPRLPAIRFDGKPSGHRTGSPVLSKVRPP
ncbi:SET domain-containing protein 5 [Madurella mycetomatis]|uniref:SET domain-containing protein 5 n=1 Tax=Madurella mycetomatis TaxID=100816 RepID=A0A175W3B7_9PEZI|nr:SET domain-containing protein 5 [Madurella mycetomatis]